MGSTVFPASMTPRTSDDDLGRSLRRHWWVIVTTVVIGAILAQLWTSQQPERFSASASILLAAPDGGVFGGVDRIDYERRLRNEVERARSLGVARFAVVEIQRVIDLPEELAGINADDVRDKIDVRAATDLDLITITATTRSPKGAQLIADAVAAGYQNLVNIDARERTDAALRSLDAYEARLVEQIAVLQTRLENLRLDAEAEVQALDARTFEPIDPFLELQRALDTNPEYDALTRERIEKQIEAAAVSARSQELLIDRELQSDGVDFIEPAEVPEHPSSPRPTINLAIGMLLGGFLGLAFVSALSNRNERIDDRGDVASLLGIPALGEIPTFSVRKLGPIPALDHPSSEIAAAIQSAVSVLEARLREMGAKVILITSPNPGDGKTISAINLAAAMAVDGRRVLVVDADLRARGLTRLAAADDAPGLVDVARGEVRLSKAVIELDGSHGNAFLLPAGALVDDADSFVRARSFERTLRMLRTSYDVVLLDVPAALPVGDATSIAQRAEGSIIVARAGTPLAGQREILNRLRLVGTPIVGALVTRTDTSADYVYPSGRGRPTRGRSTRPLRDLTGGKHGKSPL